MFCVHEFISEINESIHDRSHKLKLAETNHYKYRKTVTEASIASIYIETYLLQHQSQVKE